MGTCFQLFFSPKFLLCSKFLKPVQYYQGTVKLCQFYPQPNHNHFTLAGNRETLEAIPRILFKEDSFRVTFLGHSLSAYQHLSVVLGSGLGLFSPRPVEGHLIVRGFPYLPFAHAIISSTLHVSPSFISRVPKIDKQVTEIEIRLIPEWWRRVGEGEAAAVRLKKRLLCNKRPCGRQQNPI